MFQIGKFSRLGQITVDTLRHYDSIGLLKPMKVDSFTGYRFYSASQLKTLQQIQVLKELGFSLVEIARILQNELTDDELRGMLKMQQQTAETELINVQSRLDRIKARLQYLNSEDKSNMYDISLKSVEAQTVAAIRETVASADMMPERCSALFNTIAGWLVKNKLPFGPPHDNLLKSIIYTRKP